MTVEEARFAGAQFALMLALEMDKQQDKLFTGADIAMALRSAAVGLNLQNASQSTTGDGS